VHDAAMTIDMPFSHELAFAAAVGFNYQSCPTHKAEMDVGKPGSFFLHAKKQRPATCYATGRCVPQSSHSEVFETAGTGTVTVSTSSTVIAGLHTSFLSDLNPSNTISLYTSIFHETRQIIRVTSDVACELDHPFSRSFTSMPYIVRFNTGKGSVTNDGLLNELTGNSTNFLRDLNVGWVIAVGDEKRIVTTVSSGSPLFLNGTFNYHHGGISNSAWSFESCLSGLLGATRSYTVDSCDLKKQDAVASKWRQL